MPNAPAERATFGCRAVIRCGILLCTLIAPALWAVPVSSVSTRLPTPVAGDGASGDNFGIAIALDADTAIIGAYGDTVVATGATFGIAQGSAYVFQRTGETWTQVQKLSPDPVGSDGDNFGVALATSGDLLAVGAPRRSVNGILEAGNVFLYARGANGYQHVQILQAPTPTDDERFGGVLALWQDQLAVGVPLAHPGGRVDIYKRNGGEFTFQRSVVGSGPGLEAARFGAALAIADSELLIGAPGADGSGAVFHLDLTDGSTTAARVPVFATAGAELGASLAIDGGVALAGAPGVGGGEVRVLQLADLGWQQAALLTSASSAPGDRYGSSVALNGQRAMVSAIAALGGEGAVYVYERAGAAITAPTQLDLADGGTSSRFGASLAVAADGVLIGADLDRVGPNQGQGSVHWYQPNLGGLRLTATLDNGDGAMFDRFGSAVSVDGDIAMVGALFEDTIDGADAGSVHWFQRQGTNWVYGGALHAPDATAEDRFGVAVSVNGDRVAIGAYWDVIGNNVDQGSVYVFRRTGAQWLFEAKLTASNGHARDLFGSALSLFGDRLAIGARGAHTDQGTAYIFRREGSNWLEEAQIDLPPPTGAALFGTSLALVGDRVYVGAPTTTLVPGPFASGAVFEFERQGSSWPLVKTLLAPQPTENEAFGFAVSADSERVLVGAFQSGFAFQGVAYVYRAVDRALDGVLRPAITQPGEALGIAVALSGTSAVLGGSGYDFGNAANTGTVRVFTRGSAGWVETAQWFAVDADYGDNFGRALAIDDNQVLIGSPGKGIANPLEGMAYLGLIQSLFADGFE